MKNEPEFMWDAEKGHATCILTDGNNKFVGLAFCHDEDMDMISEKTGCTIALLRAEIDYYSHIKNNEIKPALAALKQLYYSMNRSKNFNQKSYENKMLWRQIRLKEDELALVNQNLTELRKNVKQYIDDKELFYKRVRVNRKGQDN